MDREVEFRGWDADNNCWRYGYYQKREEITLSPFGVSPLDREENVKHYIIWDGFSDWNMTKACFRAEVEAGSVGQWTGMYDRKQKKIYENDLVAYDDHYSGDYLHHPGTLPVKFEEGGFDLASTDSVWAESLAYLVINNLCEVVGNEWENSMVTT